MGINRIRLCFLALIVAVVSFQLINTLLVTKYGGYAIYRNQSGGLEFLLFKPKGQQNWTLPDVHYDNDTRQVNASHDVLEKEFGLKQTDIKEVEDYVKTVTERFKNYINMTTYRVAELVQPQAPISLSPAFVEYKWWPLLDINDYVDRRIRGIFNEINEFLAPVIYD